MEDKTGKKMIFESAFEGDRSAQLGVRISPEMNEALEAESKKRNQPLSDLVRDSIAFALIPGFLKSKLQEGTELDSKDRALLEACRSYLSEVAEACGEIDGRQRKMGLKKVDRKVKRRLERIDALLDKKVEEAVGRAIKKVFEQKKGEAK